MSSASAINSALRSSSDFASNPDPNRQLIVQAVSALNQSGQWPETSIRIHFDVETKSYTVQFVNPATDEVVDQIPSEEAIRMSQDLAPPPAQRLTSDLQSESDQ
jgi:uncharacterized FlaG/YvyC family protein